jgi:hypothetical protein
MAKSTFFTGQPVFNQLLNLMPKGLIQKAASETYANRYYKTFKANDHLVTMLYACYYRCTSIREVVTGMQANYNKLAHLGLSNVPRRSTFSEANTVRPQAFFEKLYHKLYEHYYKVLPDSRQRKSMESRLFIMDSTTISLFTDVMKGAGCPPANGRKKGGAKAHVLLEAATDLPQLIDLSNGAQNDKKFMSQVSLPACSILVFDKGYHYFAQWKRWDEQKVSWVTRLIDKEYVEVRENLPVSVTEKRKGIISDQIIKIGKGTNKITIPLIVRLVTYQDPGTQKTFQFLTNNRRFNPSTIAGIYYKRWQIELFFKRMKQHNQLRMFLGESENAIKIQIWCAFIADLLLKIIKDQLNRKWAFANLSALVKHHLMNYLNLRDFLNNPDKITLNRPNSSWQQSLFPT